MSFVDQERELNNLLENRPKIRPTKTLLKIVKDASGIRLEKFIPQMSEQDHREILHVLNMLKQEIENKTVGRGDTCGRRSKIIIWFFMIAVSLRRHFVYVGSLHSVSKRRYLS